MTTGGRVKACCSSSATTGASSSDSGSNEPSRAGNSGASWSFPFVMSREFPASSPTGLFPRSTMIIVSKSFARFCAPCDGISENSLTDDNDVELGDLTSCRDRQAGECITAVPTPTTRVCREGNFRSGRSPALKDKLFRFPTVTGRVIRHDAGTWQTRRNWAEGGVVAGIGNARAPWERLVCWQDERRARTDLWREEGRRRNIQQEYVEKRPACRKGAIYIVVD